MNIVQYCATNKIQITEPNVEVNPSSIYDLIKDSSGKSFDEINKLFQKNSDHSFLKWQANADFRKDDKVVINKTDTVFHAAMRGNFKKIIPSLIKFAVLNFENGGFGCLVAKDNASKYFWQLAQDKSVQMFYENLVNAHFADCKLKLEKLVSSTSQASTAIISSLPNPVSPLSMSPIISIMSSSASDQNSYTSIQELSSPIIMGQPNLEKESSIPLSSSEMMVDTEQKNTKRKKLEVKTSEQGPKKRCKKDPSIPSTNH